MWATTAIAPKPYMVLTTIPCTIHSSLVNSDFHCAGTKSLLGLSAIVVTPSRCIVCRCSTRIMNCPQVARRALSACHLLRFSFLFLVGLDRIIATIICHCQLFFLHKLYILVTQNVRKRQYRESVWVSRSFAYSFRLFPCAHMCSYESVGLNCDRDAI